MAKQFGAKSTTDEVLAGVDLTGKRVLVTGVSAGLGVETARTLAAHGATVVGTARDLNKAKQALDKAGAKNVELVQMDLASLKSVRAASDKLTAKGDKFDLTGVDDDGWIARQATFTAPVFDTFKVLKIDLEMPGWSPLASNAVDVTVRDHKPEHHEVPRASYLSLLVPLTGTERTVVKLDAAAVFPLPNDKRERAFLIKNVSFENLSPTDLFARGWHRSGYLFSLDRADNDGWVDRTISFSFPATKQFKTAIVEVVRFPAKADLPLNVSVDGTARAPLSLALEKTERIVIPLSPDRATALNLSAPRNFPLAAPDTRVRSFRIVTIDFQ